jgi:hypothetical protein
VVSRRVDFIGLNPPCGTLDELESGAEFVLGVKVRVGAVAVQPEASSVHCDPIPARLGFPDGQGEDAERR